MTQVKEEFFTNPSPVDSEKALSALLQKLAFDDFGILDTSTFLEDDCNCDDCNDRRSLSAESIEEIKMIQSCWLELRQYIRIVYRLSMKGSLKSIDSEYQEYMKEIVARLFDVCDPHQLFQRLEAQVKEFIIEVKILLLQILDRMSENPRLPQIFISGLLDRYNKVISAANVIEPILSRIEQEHLQKFSLTWKLLNQRLFQSIIYSDLFFQNSVPLFISQLGKGKGAENNKELVKEFLIFDDEIAQIEGQWIEIESSIMHYLHQKSSPSEKKKFLINDWDEFKTARKLENISFLEKSVSSGKRKENTFVHNISIDGLDPGILADSCECHVCLDASAHTPVELIEQVIPLNAHRSGFHLYPHIHGTRGEFGPFLPECEVPEICGQISLQPTSGEVGKGGEEVRKRTGTPSCSHVGVLGPYRTHSHACTHAHARPGVRPPLKLWQGTFGKGANKFNKLDQCISLSKHHHHQSNIKKRAEKATQKDHEVLSVNEDNIKIVNPKTTPGVAHVKDGGTDSSSHHIHCSKHSDIKRIPFSEHDDEAHHLEDSQSDNSQSDPRHCDCCYCEVFGHGLPSAAPMSRNYQEMRERLRLLLNKKKSKCKNNPSSISPQQIAHRKQQPSGGNHPTNSERDTRALEDLLDFIEGTEVKCRNEKKAAKKARQKEKKRILLNRKKREEEEKARLLEESIQQQKKREEIKEMEEKARMNKAKKKGAKINNNNPTAEKTSSSTSSSLPKPGPQMVTIKRVMEPHNSEPTVTITLRGATPNQDRVLYTLLNGQVCKMKDFPNEKKFTGKNTNAKNNTPNVSYKVKELVNEKQKIKKDARKNDINTSLNSKPAKELTNPTSIQINNAINSLSKKPSPSFNIADIKLPPGITITKVDPSSVQSRSSKIQENNSKKVNPPPARPPSEVIVVSTGQKRKDPPILKESVPENQTGKKKKSKKKNNTNNTTSTDTLISNNGKSPSYPGLEIQPIKLIEPDKDQDLANHMSVLTISPYAENKTEKNENAKKKKKKQKKVTPHNTINPEEWKLLDSVFAPKDIDLDDGEMDDAERELEAFKRFCLQSIPPERKEKVHLNIKDIVLKKKSSTFNY